jgi:glycolate oxidase iron-sulfur subunit
VTSDEADGPRGRIVLMQGFARGTLTPGDPQLRVHLDRCLGCRACETACPSGVAYGHALESVRAELVRHRAAPPAVRAVNAVMRWPVVRRLILGVARAVRPIARTLAGPSRPGFLMAMLGATVSPNLRHRTSAYMTRSHGKQLRTAALFTGCIMDDLFGHVHRATERVLRVNGYEVLRPRSQACCGALHAHAGDHDGAVQLAAANVEAFAALPADVVIAVNSAGCGAMLREYPRVLRGHPREAQATALADRVQDVTELLAAVGPRAGGSLPLRVAYDAPCHLVHAQRVADAPLRVLEAIPDLVLVPHHEADLCCGSAGSYTLAEPHLSRDVLNRKLDSIRSAAPDIVVTGNPGCIMQIGGGLLANGDPIEVVHPVELLDRAYAEAGFYEPMHA